MADDIVLDRVLRMEHRFRASPERVFDAWTTPDLLAAWWGPEGMTCPEKALDVRIGGRWRTVMLAADGTRRIVGGVYRRIERPRVLAFTWAWEQADGAPGHETEITLTFDAQEGGTLMTLVQREFQDQPARDSHAGGWRSSFACLAAFLGQG